MSKAMNLSELTCYREILAYGESPDCTHPALQRMGELSASITETVPTAVTRLEVFKECHRLAEELYGLTGSKKMVDQVLRIGDLLLSRVFSGAAESRQVNR